MPERRGSSRGSSAQPFRRTLEGARSVLVRWGGKHFGKYPWRFEKNHFHALIAEVLLQRTRADQVVPAFKLFKRTFPRPSDLGAATESRILKVIGPLGLHWRARFLKLLGQELAKMGRTPREVDELVRLPGIGPYAASAYVSFHRGKRGVLLDSNIVRFYGRLLGLPTGPETRRTRVFKDIAEAATPSGRTRAYNYALLDFTRTICAPRPSCPRCPLLRRCIYGRRTASWKKAN